LLTDPPLVAWRDGETRVWVFQRWEGIVIKLGKLVAGIGIVGVLGLGQAQAVILNEGFDGPIPPPGWTIINNSTGPGTTSWFKGDPAVFAAQAGADDSYAAANFNAATFGGNIRNWLLTPTVKLHNGAEFTFSTRTETGSTFGDQLAARLCVITPVQDCTNTAGFVTDLIPLFTVPDVWTQEFYTFSGLGNDATGRIGFFYRVNDTSVNGDYIGIDSVNIPEPSTLAVFALGLAMLGWNLRRGNAR
jgi:hypothetical protein